MTKIALTMAAALIGGTVLNAQTQPPAGAPVTTQGTPITPAAPAPRPASPAGSAQTQVAGEYVKDANGRERYQNGKWLEITYGRPLKRGREVFGQGADYAKLLLANGATVWRAGANVSTQLTTEVPLVIGGKTVPAGTYTLFIDTKSPTDWTLIVSSWGAKKTGRDETPNTLWGSFNYTADKDVARAPMTISKLALSLDQLTWAFADVTKDGGKIAIAWDTTLAFVPFTVGK